MKREYCHDYLIDGRPLLVPDQNINITENDLDFDSSGRDESGYMHRLVMRHGVKTWELTYAVLDAEDYAYIHSLFERKPTFAFTYKDVYGETAVTTAYCSKRSITLRDYATGEYKNLKFNIIEC